MNTKRFKNSRYLSILTAVLIFIISVNAPMTTFAAESEAPAGSTESTAEAAVAEPFRYEHDPMENPDAVVDIVVNPDAVYGYSPNPDSARLGKYADALDWTDPDQVAAARQERAEYHESINGLYRLIEDMLGEGKNVEEIARAVSKERNEIRLASYDGDPDGLAIVKKSNLDTYGQEEGPTPDQLYEQYGSWQTVIEKALSSNPGMDACLGFYDEYYDTYDISDKLGALPDADDSANAAADDSANAAADAETADEPDTSSGSSKTYTVKKGDCLWNRISPLQSLATEAAGRRSMNSIRARSKIPASSMQARNLFSPPHDRPDHSPGLPVAPRDHSPGLPVAPARKQCRQITSDL